MSNVIFFSIISIIIVISLSILSSLMVYLQGKQAWMKMYLLTSVLILFDEIVTLLVFFYKTYLVAGYKTSTLFDICDSILFMLVLFMLPHFILSLCNKKPSKTAKIFILINPIFLFSMLILAGYLTEMYPDSLLAVFSYLLFIISKALSYALITYYLISGIRKRAAYTSDPNRKIFYYVLYILAFYFPLSFLSELFADFFLEEADYFSYLFTLFVLFCWFLTVLVNNILSFKHANLSQITAIPDSFIDKFSVTLREKEIIDLLLHGESSKSIHQDLDISIRTVDTHIYNIYKKCEVSSRIELANLISKFS